MLYRMKEAFWSLGGTYWIQDADGRGLYEVRGKVFSWGDSLSMLDSAGREVAQIKQQLFRLMPTYNLIREGREFATIKKEFTWFKKSFTLDVPGPNDYSINGDFWAHEFEFVRGGARVARISKTFWSWTDSYGVEIVDGEDDVSILATAVVIDLVLHEEQND